MGESHSARVVFFEQALGRLEEALAKPEDPIVRDACIQRFEFTFEMAWKAVQSYALAEGVECASPRDCFRTAFRLGLMGSDPQWLGMTVCISRSAAATPGGAPRLGGTVSPLRQQRPP